MKEDKDARIEIGPLCPLISSFWFPPDDSFEHEDSKSKEKEEKDNDSTQST